MNITANGYDRDSANVYTDSTGFYVRFINPGTYSITFLHPDYLPRTIDSVTIDDFNSKYDLTVELEKPTGIKKTLPMAKQFITVSQTI